MVDGAEGKNTSSSPQENSCARENQSYANQLSNLNDVFEENKRKNVADLNAQIRAYRAKHNKVHKSTGSNTQVQIYRANQKEVHNRSLSSQPNKIINKFRNHKSLPMDSMTAHNAPPKFRLPNSASRLKPNNIVKYFKVNSTRDYGDENLFRERVMYRKPLHRSQTRTLDWRKYLEHVYRVTRI